MHSVVLFVAGVLTGAVLLFGVAFVVSYLLDDKQRDFWAG